MAWYEIFIVSVGLSLDVFTYALYKGAMLSRLDKKQILKIIIESRADHMCASRDHFDGNLLKRHGKHKRPKTVCQ